MGSIQGNFLKIKITHNRIRAQNNFILKSMQTKHSKHYAEPEESWHYNIFLASKAGVETQNKLHEKGLESFKKELDEWSDVPLKEVAVPGYDTLSADEWAKYKVKLTIHFN